MPKEWWCATTTLTTQFIGGASEGRVVATGRLLRRGQSVAFASGEVRDQRGKIVASATGIWHLWPHRPDKRPVRPTARGAVVMRETGEPVPVGKILAVGRNYADHIVEMGGDPDREPPFFFQKNPDNLDPSGEFPYPSKTSDVHHEAELAVFLKSGGIAVVGYGTALASAPSFLVRAAAASTRRRTPARSPGTRSRRS